VDIGSRVMTVGFDQQSTIEKQQKFPVSASPSP
jgi:hypothetical protein